MEIGSRGYETNGINKDGEKDFHPEVKAAFGHSSEVLSTAEAQKEDQSLSNYNTADVTGVPQNPQVGLSGQVATEFESSGQAITSTGFESSEQVATSTGFESSCQVATSTGFESSGQVTAGFDDTFTFEAVTGVEELQVLNNVSEVNDISQSYHQIAIEEKTETVLIEANVTATSEAAATELVASPLESNLPLETPAVELPKDTNMSRGADESTFQDNVDTPANASNDFPKDPNVSTDAEDNTVEDNIEPATNSFTEEINDAPTLESSGLPATEILEELPLTQEQANDETADVVPMGTQPVLVEETVQVPAQEQISSDQAPSPAAAEVPPSNAEQVAADVLGVVDIAEPELADANVEEDADAEAEPVPEVVDVAADVPKSDAAVKLTAVTEEEIQSIKGQKVKKKFGKKTYAGDVVSYDPETNWFKVVYEDGDEEDLDLSEVKEILASDVQTPLSSGKKRSRADGGSGDDDGHKSSKKPKSTAKGSGPKSSAKSPKTPARSTVKKARSLAKSTKKALASPKTPQETAGKKTASKSSKAVSSKKTGTSKVSRSLNLQSPKTQSKSTSRRSLKTPKKEASGAKRKPEEEGASDLKAKRAKEVEVGDQDVDPLVGRKVKKDFSGTLYSGVVAKFDKKTQYFQVEYEDGDQEELERHELEPILVEEAIDEDKGANPSLSSIPAQEPKVATQSGRKK